ncbi:hypothetical protein FACS1894137_11980 [Spirochaetia bacterium]|nr:hypothetical protein FACS1894137_11980 [Spirochaetia bacterium]
MGKNKVKIIEKVFADIKLDDTVSYSDSKSDIPLLKWTTIGVVVSKNHHQPWINDDNFKEIIWG